MLKHLGLFVAAFGLSFVLTPIIRRIAVRFKILDDPGGRKIHTTPTPRLGGLAIFVAFAAVCIGISIWDPSLLGAAGSRISIRPLLVGGLLVVLLGAFDDIFGVKPAVKFLFQCLAGLILILAGFSIQSVSDPAAIGEQFHIGVWGVLLSFIWIVGITNALNLIDGLDGLAAGVAIIATISFGVFGFITNQMGTMVLSVVLAGAIAGFLRFNLYPASIFLGDSGSLFLGFVLAAISILGSYKSATVVSILVPMLALGIPLMDTLLAMLRRLLRSLHLLDMDDRTGQWKILFLGKSAVWNADQDHIHHRLIKFGLSQRKAVMILYGASVVLTLGALSLMFLHSVNYGYFLAAVALLVFLSIRRLGYEEFKVSPEVSLLWMYRHRFVGVRLFQGLADLVFIAGSFVAALLLRADDNVDWVKLMLSRYVWIVLLIQIVTFLLSGFYKGAWRYTNLRDMLSLTRGVFFACLLAYVLAGTFVKEGWVEPAVFVNDFFILVFFVIASRMSYRILNLLRKSRRKEGREVLIYGAGDGGAMTLRESINNIDLGLIPLGFLDDDPGKKGKTFNGLKVFGGFDELDGILGRNHVSGIILSTSKIPVEKIEQIKKKCAQTGVPVQRLMFSLENL